MHLICCPVGLVNDDLPFLSADAQRYMSTCDLCLHAQSPTAHVAEGVPVVTDLRDLYKLSLLKNGIKAAH